MQHADGASGPIRSEFAEDPDMLELVEEFVAQLPSRVADLRASFATGDAAAVSRMAHQLSGACGGYGFPVVGDAARSIENSLRQLEGDGGLDRVKDQVDVLVDLCRRVVV